MGRAFRSTASSPALSIYKGGGAFAAPCVPQAAASPALPAAGSHVKSIGRVRTVLCALLPVGLLLRYREVGGRPMYMYTKTSAYDWLVRRG